MVLDIMGSSFSFVARIEPDLDPKGGVREFMPQDHYDNARQLALNPHGAGPFCRFRVAPDLRDCGVYAVTVDRVVVYIGECENLSERFGPRGYGSIHPRNCFVRGQPTNCRVNNLILQQAKRGQIVELWFRQTAGRKDLEASLIEGIQPAWNIQGRVTGPSAVRALLTQWRSEAR